MTESVPELRWVAWVYLAFGAPLVLTGLILDALGNPFAALALPLIVVGYLLVLRFAVLRGYARAWDARGSDDVLCETRAGSHDYLSTACYHTQHELCRQTCKYCFARCRCWHHNGTGVVRE